MAVRVSAPQKNGNKYYFDVSYKDNGITKRYRSKLYATRKEAKTAEAEFLSRPTKKEAPTVHEVIDSYIASRSWKPSSKKSLLKKIEHIDNYFGKYRIDTITLADCKAFLAHLDKQKSRGNNLSPTYKNMVLTYLKSVCRYSELYFGRTTKAPLLVGRIKPPKGVRRIYTKEDFDQFIRYVPEVYAALFTFLMYSGCRLGEALGLHFSDIDFEARTFSISKSFSQLEHKDVATKTESSVRTLPLSDKAYEALYSMYIYYKDKRGFASTWRPFGGQKYLPDTTITRIKNKACDAAGLPRIRVHDFRHSFVSILISQGANVTMVSKYVGHSTVSTTLNVYSHYFEKDLKGILQKL